MKEWVCIRCVQEVYSNERPDPIKWTDGHVCRFIQRTGESYSESEWYNGEAAEGASEKKSIR